MVYLMVLVFIILNWLAISCIKIMLDLRDINLDKDNNVKAVAPSYVLWGVAVVFGWFFSVVAGIELQTIDTRELDAGFIFVFMSACMALILLFWQRSVIIYDEKGFSIGWRRFMMKYYLYEEITSIERTQSGYFIKIGKRRLYSDFYNKSFHEFKEYVLDRYAEKYEGKTLEIINEIKLHDKYPKLDVYHGNLKNPVMHLIGIMGIQLIALGFLLFGIFCVLHTVEEADTEYVEADILSYTLYENTLRMEVEGYEYEFVLFLDEQIEKAITEIEETICRDWTLNMHVQYHSRTNGHDFMIYNIEDRYGNTYVTFEEVNAYENQREVALVYVAIGLWAVMTVWSYFYFCIGRNPQKYTKRIRRLFYKDYCWNIKFDD